jgi:hypothetical protein
MMIRQLLVAICCLMASAAWAGEGADLAWIGHLDGVTPLIQAGTKGERAVYQVSDEPGAVFKRVAAGLTERGWTLNEGASIGEGVRALTAIKGQTRVEVGLTGTTLSVSTGRHDARGPGESVRVSGGGAFTVVDSHTDGTFECRNGDDGDILGNNNHVTVKGACRRLTLSGNDNELRVEGSVERLEAPGNHNTAHISGTVQRVDAAGNHNQVVWSASQNPKRPRVNSPGTGNDLHSD